MFLFFLLPQNTKVYLCLFTGKMDLVCGQSNSCQVFTIKQGRRRPILIPYDIQGCKSFAEKAAKGLTKKKTHEGAIGGRGRERSISGGRDGKAIQDINRDSDLAPHIQKIGRPQVGFPFSQANGGVEGQDESWGGLEREKGSGGRDRGSMGGG